MYKTNNLLEYQQFTENSEGCNLYFPVEVDTEYTHPANLDNPELQICTNITVQCRATWKNVGTIYAHPDISDVARHKLFKYEFVVWDYLNDLGYSVEPVDYEVKEKNKILPWLQVDIFAFFGLAELYRIFQGDYLKDINNFVLFGVKKHGVIEQTRRLITCTQKGRNYQEMIETPWHVMIDNYVYRVRLSFKDTSAIQGKSSYKDFCSNSNIDLKYKDNFTKEEKARMLEMYQERPEDFDNYALGDLYNYDALLGNAYNFKSVYQSLGLSNYYTPPRMTIGSTVSKLINSGINNLFDYQKNDSKLIKKYCHPGSSDKLKRYNTTACLNAKVDGGRCRNNRPTDSHVKGLLCDIDISGCYGEGLRVQTYPLGIPRIIDYPRGSQYNEYLSLGKFLKEYGDDLVPGLWQARVSLKEGKKLHLPQDYLMSWIPPKDINKLITDSDVESTEQWWELDNIGTVKIFHYDVQNAIVTHDFIQWLDNVATKHQRNELLNKLYVYTAMWYPKQARVDSIDRLEEEHNKFTGKNKTSYTVGVRRKKISVEESCPYWYGINLGELIVDKLLIERKKHKKKTPLNNLYKLCVNTVYGDMVSPYFPVGNVVVGNNITARARTLAWCMEKGLNGFQTITDGCTFELESVPYVDDGRKLSAHNTVKIYLDRPGDNIRFKSLLPEIEGLESDKIKVETMHNQVGDKLTLKEEYNQLISEFAWTHLQESFSGLDVLHQQTNDVYGKSRQGQFSFEVKGIFDEGVFHGSANYGLFLRGQSHYKMRSYSQKPRRMVTSKDDELIFENDVQIVHDFLNSLKESSSVPRSNVYVKESILKLGDYKNKAISYSESRLLPGYTQLSARLLREFSLSQFTFRNYEQYKSWKSEFNQLRNKYQQSYEMFFLHKNGHLNYQKMVDEINTIILSGDSKYRTHKRFPNDHSHRFLEEHDSAGTLDLIKTKLKRMYNMK